MSVVSKVVSFSSSPQLLGLSSCAPLVQLLLLIASLIFALIESLFRILSLLFSRISRHSVCYSKLVTSQIPIILSTGSALSLLYPVLPSSANLHYLLLLSFPRFFPPDHAEARARPGPASESPELRNRLKYGRRRRTVTPARPCSMALFRVQKHFPRLSFLFLLYGLCGSFRVKPPLLS